MKRKHNSRFGFTIVELLIVIVVIAILAAISIVAFTGIQQRARDSQRKSDVAQIAKGLMLWSTATGGQFATMNSGNGGPASGWFDTNYGGGSVQEILQSGGYIASNVNDPKRSSSSNNRWRYMVVPCTDDTSDNRRIVMTELETPPSQSVAVQSQQWSCNSSRINSYASLYYMNYLTMADVR